MWRFNFFAHTEHHKGVHMSEKTSGLIIGLFIAAIVAVLWWVTSHNVVVFNFPKML